MVGQSIAHYKISEKIGAGGMGEVYRARDTKLNRDVALKVLPAAFAEDQQRMARFSREAKVLASLNHPNIAAIHGLEEQEGTCTLVLELVEGETLDERIRRGPLPLGEALEIALQIARALEAAHEKGVIHRDLKPANVKITPQGRVKVLDFGLAKAQEADAAGSDLADSPTLSLAATQAGVILGTAGYMSPEQARGRRVDRRADIWSFGCVLYEMLSGHPAFPGEDVSEILAFVITREPEWQGLAGLPTAVRDLLERCLRKDPAMRLPDIAVVRIAIEEHQTGEPSAPEGRAAAGHGSLALGAVALTGIMVGLLAAFWLAGPEIPARTAVARYDLILDSPAADFARPRISQDGRRFVYAGGKGGNTVLYLRDLAQTESWELPGTENARQVFLSPDGRWAAFFSAGRLKKVALAGGLPVALCSTAGLPRGGVWTPDGRLIFTTASRRVPAWVPAGGGEAKELELSGLEDSTSVGSLEMLPGGKALLVTLFKGRPEENAQVGIVSLETGEVTVLTRGSSPLFVPPHYVVYLQGETLLGASLDLGRLQLDGSGQTIPGARLGDTVNQDGIHYLRASVSSEGVLLHSIGTPSDLSELVWVDRQGVETQTGLPGPGDLSLAPDGRRVVSNISGDLWLLDAAAGTRMQLTFGGRSSYPRWAPDGRRVAFIDNSQGSYHPYLTDVQGSGEQELVTDLPDSVGTSFSPDGAVLLGYRILPRTNRDLWVFPLKGEPRAILATPHNERAGVFSPDGRLVAYVSDQDGRDQIYVRRYPEMNRSWKASSDGGREPQWSYNGRELFYLSDTHLMAVQVRSGPGVQLGRPEPLFDVSAYFRDPFGNAKFGVTSDGRFLFGKATAGSVERLGIVLNWSAELQRLLNGE